MNRKLMLAGAIFAAAMSLASNAFAGAADYVFEPVKAEVRKGDNATVAVRLMHKPTGKPVTNAVIVRTRIDMTPDGMAEMAAPLKLLPAKKPGVYAFKTNLSMAGRWQLSVDAKVQNEPETVTGKVTYKATR